MSEFRIDQIKNKAGTSGPNIAGITTFTGSSGIVMPSGDTRYRYSATDGEIVKDGLVLWLDAGKQESFGSDGTVWRDLSGQGSNGTLTNGVGFSVEQGGSLEFDGVNDYVDLTSSSASFDFGTENFSLSCFIKGTGVSGYRCIFWHHYNPGFTLITNITTGVARFWLGGTAVNGNKNILDNVWHNVIVIRNSNIISIYVDGVLDVSSTSFLGRSATVSDATAAIGRYTGEFTDYPFDGNISQVSIYNRALSSQEVQQNYNALKRRYGL
jgi:hypothetical protein